MKFGWNNANAALVVEYETATTGADMLGVYSLIDSSIATHISFRRDKKTDLVVWAGERRVVTHVSFDPVMLSPSTQDEWTQPEADALALLSRTLIEQIDRIGIMELEYKRV